MISPDDMSSIRRAAELKTREGLDTYVSQHFKTPAQMHRERLEQDKDDFMSSIYDWINTFQDGLDDKHTTAVTLGMAIPFKLLNIEFWSDRVIRFSGIDEAKNPVELLQHVTQLSIQLTALPLDDEPKRAIGFHWKPEDDAPTDGQDD